LRSPRRSLTLNILILIISLKGENVNREFFKKQNLPIPHFISTFMSSFLKENPPGDRIWKFLENSGILFHFLFPQDKFLPHRIPILAPKNFFTIF